MNELPAGVFVWKDEFEPRYLRRYGRHGTTFMTAAGDVMSEDEQQRRVVLNFAPFIAEPEIRCLILEGFESEVAAGAREATPCDEFTAFSPLFAPWIESTFEALPKSLQDQWRTESMVAWDVLAPHQRKFFLQQRDFKNDPSTQVERTAAWLKYTMDADMWWRTEAVTPVHAAMLLSRWNPNKMSAEDAETHSSDEMGPQDFRRLRNTFEGADKSANRTLQHWVDYARQRNLRIHSWIGEWEECMHALQAETISQATPQRAEGAPSAPVQRSAAQEAAIIATIRSAGHDPLTLPVNEPGKPGVKAVIRKALNSDSLFVGTKVFDKAWERLRRQGDIADRADKT